jgi:hypothetical protein
LYVWVEGVGPHWLQGLLLPLCPCLPSILLPWHLLMLQLLYNLLGGLLLLLLLVVVVVHGLMYEQ